MPFRVQSWKFLLTTLPDAAVQPIIRAHIGVRVDTVNEPYSAWKWRLDPTPIPTIGTQNAIAWLGVDALVETLDG
jgi:hypothetical protein